MDRVKPSSSTAMPARKRPPSVRRALPVAVASPRDEQLAGDVDQAEGGGECAQRVEESGKLGRLLDRVRLLIHRPVPLYRRLSSPAPTWACSRDWAASGRPEGAEEPSLRLAEGRGIQLPREYGRVDARVVVRVADFDVELAGVQLDVLVARDVLDVHLAEGNPSVQVGVRRDAVR